MASTQHQGEGSSVLYEDHSFSRKLAYVGMAGVVASVCYRTCVDGGYVPSSTFMQSDLPHAAASAVLATIYAVTSRNLWVGAAFALAGGMVHEIIQMQTGWGQDSVEDLVANAVGVSMAVGISKIRRQSYKIASLEDVVE